MGPQRFRLPSRAAAGRALADAVADLRLAAPLVLALPRGGIPVAVEIAARLSAPLDLVLVRKIGAPGNPELALAAVVEGDPPETVVNEVLLRLLGPERMRDRIARETAVKIAEIAARRRAYLGARPRLAVTDRDVVLVDDGLATGTTARAAIAALRRQGAGSVVLAVPVAPSDTLEEMRALADRVVCLHDTDAFGGVGAFYDDFHQLDDAEAVALLDAAWARDAGANG